MRVNVPLLELLREIRALASIVVATDNMDCFAETFRRLRGGRRPTGRGSTETLAWWASDCDDLISSSDVAVLKDEDAARFFMPWLSRHGMTFRDALLIDDSTSCCAAFREQGGTALRWRMGDDDLSGVATVLNGWLGHAPKP
ncbi:hypothetical protein GCM10009850_053590 [Nonomuraea monospora]|uniref:FCP1 homology domain-containing protein n=1 Tax=Nonomuraea monospora TaxID=568818 RepID=A0ABN3CKZ7_9ACTN